MPDAVVPQLDAPWYRLTVRDLPLEGGEPFTVVMPDPGAERPPVPVDAVVGRVRFGRACPGAGAQSLASGAEGRFRCFAGGPAATRAAVGSWVSAMAPCRGSVAACGPGGHPVVVWVDARDADAVERSLIVTGLQLLAGITASQPAFLARAVALEWLGRTEGWVMAIEGDRGAELAGWLPRRFPHGTFAFCARRSPQPPGACFPSGTGAVVAADLAPDPAGRHFADLGMGAAGDFGGNGDMIGLYSSLAVAGGERGAAGTADRLWAAGDYVRALRWQRLAAAAADAGGAEGGVERVRLENNLACLYAALLRPAEAVAVLEACRDRLGRQDGDPVPEVVEVNLGLCYLQLTDMTGRDSGDVPLDSAAKAHLADLDRRSASILEKDRALRSLEETAWRARRAAAGRHRERAVAVFEALLRRHRADTESPYACQLRDCLAFSLLAGYDGYSVWPASAASDARALFQENVIWHGMVSGESADVTLRSRARAATVAGVTVIPGSASAPQEAMAELRQVLDAAGETSPSTAAQCALALSHLAIEWAPDDAAPYAAVFAEYCLQAAGPEHPWARFAAGHLEQLRLPDVAFQPDDPYPVSVKVWEGPYAARPVRHLGYPEVVPYLLAGDVPGAAARCYQTAAAATAQRQAKAGFHAELRAALEWRCTLELNDIQRHEGASADLAQLRSQLTEILDRDSGILQLASPYTVFIHGC